MVGRVMSLDHALTDPMMRPLPGRADHLLRLVGAPPRLGAHLRAVHDVAARILDWPVLRDAILDREAVLFGAATHDIGKSLHPGELSGPGTAHEQAGHRLLLEYGVEERLARFARTHGDWGEGVELEDLLVSLADKIWKGKRVPDLEQLVVDRLAGPRQPWEIFMELDDLITHVTGGADARLAFQADYPIT